jgi:DNA-binding transcriptional LysR family regulator
MPALPDGSGLLALVYESTNVPMLRIRGLATVPVVVIGRRIDPKLANGVGLDDLRSLPLIMPRRPNAIRAAVEAACARRGVPLDVAFEVDAISAVLDLAYRGVGFALLPAFSVRGEGESRRFATAPVRPTMTSTIALAVPAQRPLAALGTATASLIESDIAPLLGASERRSRPVKEPSRSARRGARP